MNFDEALQILHKRGFSVTKVPDYLVEDEGWSDHMSKEEIIRFAHDQKEQLEMD